jgi:surface protein
MDSDLKVMFKDTIILGLIIFCSFNTTSASAGTMATLISTNFTGTSAVSFGGTATNSFTVVSPPSIIAAVGSGKTRSLSVITPISNAILTGFTSLLSSNADLSALIISAGTLSPLFASGTQTYTASVSNTTTSITVTPTQWDDDATIQIQVNGGGYTTVSTATASGALALNLGSNIVDVKVTAQDGLTIKNYTITVTRLLQPMITTWETDALNNIKIPLIGDGYDFTIDWGDGTTETKTGALRVISHTYSVAGTKTVSIMPNIITGFPGIIMGPLFGNRGYLRTVEQWGSGQWKSMLGAFRGATNLSITATDVPDLSVVTSFRGMFDGCTALSNSNGSMLNWVFTTDSSKSIDMSQMFFSATKFNQDLNNWNVSNVTNMTDMFNRAAAFNQDISSWNVSNVTNMTGMFNRATAFNQDIGSWKVSNVINMTGMFTAASAFNQDISSWNVSNVTNMTGMFSSATAFNQKIGSWKVSNVTNMSRMFFLATAFNQDISSWEVSKVTNMDSMFSGARAFNQDLGSWDISSLQIASSFMNGIALSRVNYDNILIGWSTLSSGENKIPMGINIDFGSSKYSNSTTVVDSRTKLVSNLTWVITDGGIVSVLTNSGEASGSHVINVNKNGGLGSTKGISKNGEIIN